MKIERGRDQIYMQGLASYDRFELYSKHNRKSLENLSRRMV